MTRRLWAAVPLLLLAVVISAAAPEAEVTVEGKYFGLTSGPLGSATIAVLPVGVVLSADALTLTASDVDAHIAASPLPTRPHLAQNRFLVLEQLAMDRITAREARAWAAQVKRDATKEEQADLVDAYLESLCASATVADADVRAFYAKNEALFGGAQFAWVAASIRRHLLKLARERIVEEWLAGTATRYHVAIDGAWLATQAPLALDNPVDRARRSGKPALVDFGAGGCVPCDMMAPILEELAKGLAGRCAVLFSSVREAPVLAERYGIETIPVQVFFDREGREVERHIGYMPKDQVLERLARLGVE